MIGIYMSGTGNTKHCIEKLIHLFDEKAKTVPMESDLARDALKEHSFVVIAYPVQYSNIPMMVRILLETTRNTGMENRFCVWQQWVHLAETVPDVQQDC